MQRKLLILVEGHGDAYDCLRDQCREEIIRNLNRICDIIEVRAGLNDLGLM